MSEESENRDEQRVQEESSGVPAFVKVRVVTLKDEPENVYLEINRGEKMSMDNAKIHAKTIGKELMKRGLIGPRDVEFHIVHARGGKEYLRAEFKGEKKEELAAKFKEICIDEGGLEEKRAKRDHDYEDTWRDSQPSGQTKKEKPPISPGANTMESAKSKLGGIKGKHIPASVKAVTAIVLIIAGVTAVGLAWLALEGAVAGVALTRAIFGIKR